MSKILKNLLHSILWSFSQTKEKLIALSSLCLLGYSREFEPALRFSVPRDLVYFLWNRLISSLSKIRNFEHHICSNKCSFTQTETINRIFFLSFAKICVLKLVFPLKDPGIYPLDDAKEESARILRKARRRKRKHFNTIIIDWRYTVNL